MGEKMKEYGILILKCIFCYIYMIGLIRLLGKKEFSQLNVFDFVVFLIVSEVVTMSLEGGLSLWHSVLATVTIVMMDRLFSTWSNLSKKAQDTLEGTPVYLITHGQVHRAKMKELRFSIDDLSQALRSHDVSSLSEVEFAILERNGEVSILKKEDCIVDYPDALINDGLIDEYALNQVSLTKEQLQKELEKQGIYRIEEVFYCIKEKDGLFVILK